MICSEYATFHRDDATPLTQDRPKLYICLIIHLSIMLADSSHYPSCYFSIHVPSPRNDHFALETPDISPPCNQVDQSTSDPVDLLRTYTAPIVVSQPASPNAMNSFMQAQVNASHGHSTSRPRPNPVQRDLHTTSDDSSSSSSSGDSTRSGSSLEVARCSRCHRTPALDVNSGKSNMIEYGLNLWYCSRCANIVGLLIDR